VHLLDKPGAVQTTLLLGLPVIDASQPDYVALVVTDTLLGGYSASRITANIRENKGYTYSPSSQLTLHRGDAYWSEQADVTTNVTASALREIFAEIARLAAEPPAPAELRAVQNYLAGTFVIRNSSRGGLIEQLDFVRRHGLTRAFLDEYVSRVYAITPQKVQQVTRDILRGDAMTIVAVGDRQAIGDSLATFGPVE
jgi:predicted Zn-dependent peptidase